MNNPAPARRWRWVLPVLQVVALVGAAVYMARAIRSYGPTLTRTPITLSWGPLIVASVVWYVSFIQLVQSWTASLVWWGWRLRWGVGLRVFFFSNLARYIPGGIWQFAGLAALAMDAGGSPLDASAAVLLLQLVLLITGLLITFSAAPATLGPRVAALSGAMRPLIAGVAAVAIVAGAPRAAPCCVASRS